MIHRIDLEHNKVVKFYRRAFAITFLFVGLCVGMYADILMNRPDLTNIERIMWVFIGALVGAIVGTLLFEIVRRFAKFNIE